MPKGYLIIDCGTTNLRVTLLDEQKRIRGFARADGGVRHTAIDGHNGRLRSMLKGAMDEVLAWKMPGAGGGGYLALVVKDSQAFCQQHPEAIPLTIRRL